MTSVTDGNVCISAMLETREQGVTSHKADYQRWVVEPVRVTMKDRYEPIAEPFDGLATYTTAYVRHNQPVRASMKPDDSAAMSDAPLQVRHPHPHASRLRLQRSASLFRPNM